MKDISQNKLLNLVIFLLVLGCGSIKAENSTLKTDLIDAIHIDQQHRKTINQLSKKNNTSLIEELKLIQKRLDQDNINTLNEIITELGHWPGISDVGEEAAKVAIIIFKRSSPAQQQIFLPEMYSAVQQNNLPAHWYAEAHDYHLMQQNLPQKYGQLLIKGEANELPRLYPFASTQAVNVHREALGLTNIKSALGEKNWLFRIQFNHPNEHQIMAADDLFKMADLALNCIDKTYPNSIKHVLNNDNDAQTPMQLYPAFYGCFDWHSAVHGHWLLARVAHLFPNHQQTKAIKERLAAHFTDEKLNAELAYFQQPGRAGFERPYGIAWYLQLYAELYDWDDDQAQAWLKTLTPLKNHIVQQFSDWIPKLHYPIRTGEHSQTAFAFGLALDYAEKTNDLTFSQLLRKHIKRLYLQDSQCPINYEPSGQDFLSPCLAQADLMRRVLNHEVYAKWLKKFLPKIKQGKAWLSVAQVTDRTDGKLAHLDGLNIARAWMLEGIASGLPHKDKRIKTLQKLAATHASSGLAAVTGDHYAGGHWLGSFATYYLTQSGLSQAAAKTPP